MATKLTGISSSWW